MGLPNDFTRLVSNLYSWAITKFRTPHGHTPPVGIRHGTLEGVPLSPLFLELTVKPLIRWLTVSDKGYEIVSCGLKLARKWYVDDNTFVTNSVEYILSLLDIIQ